MTANDKTIKHLVEIMIMDEPSTRLKGIENILSKLTESERLLINGDDIYKGLLLADEKTKELAARLDKKGIREDYKTKGETWKDT